MGLFRLLILVALIAAAVWLWRRLTKKPAAPKETQQVPLTMVRCAQCGVHVPREHALPNHDQWYCSQAHLKQGSQSGGH